MVIGVLLVLDLASAIVVQTVGRKISKAIVRRWNRGDNQVDEEILDQYHEYMEHRREDDQAIRRFLIGEMDRGRQHITTVMNKLTKQRDIDGAMAGRGCLDELDLLVNDVRLAPTQKAITFFDILEVGKRDKMDKLKELDLKLLENLSVIAETARTIAGMQAERKEVAYVDELDAVAQYIRDTRDVFKQRTATIESMG